MISGKYSLQRPTLTRLSPFPTPRRSVCGIKSALIPRRTFARWLLEFNQPLTFDYPVDIEPGAADTKMERAASPCVTERRAGGAITKACDPTALAHALQQLLNRNVTIISPRHN